LTLPGILVTAVQNKERSAERELVEALETIADELYPETIAGAEDGDAGEGEAEEEDMEAMLKRELSGISSDQKSKRFRLCRHETACCE
jgi:tRNA acetyltransferase TAN1